MHTYPEVLFRGVNLTSGGGNCNPDKAPVERHISFGSASNILGDPEEVCLNLLPLLWLLELEDASSWHLLQMQCASSQVMVNPGL